MNKPTRGGGTTTTGNGPAHLAPQDGAVLPELLTTAEAAKLAGVGGRTWWRWIRSGLAPAPIFIGNGPRPAVRYSRQVILAWITGGCKPVDGGRNR